MISGYASYLTHGGVQAITETPYDTAKVWPQEHADKNKAPSPRAGGSNGQEQEGSGQPSHHVPNIVILFINPLCSLFEGVPKQDPKPKRTRTERTLVEKRDLVWCPHCKYT